MVRRWLNGAFLVAGFTFAVLQTLAIRELLVSFSGSELSIGLILGAWLLVQALGSGLAGRWAARLPDRPGGYAILQGLLAAALLPCLALVLRARGLLGAVPGEAIPFLPALAVSLLVLAPWGVLGGAAFVVGCRSAAAVGRVYALEAAGSAAGGVAFTYLLLPYLSSTQIVLLLVALNAFSAAVLLRPAPVAQAGAAAAAHWWRPLLAGLWGLGALLALFTPAGPALHRALVAGRWAPHALAYEGNSPYGNVAVVTDDGQVAVFASGALVLTSPDPDAAAVEQFVHLPVLFLDGPPRRVLVIGGGVGGVLAELERYPLERIDYAEPDPLLIRAVQAVPTALTAAELADPRLHVAVEDGRRFVQHAAAPYDLVLLNLPPPTTLSLNRLYTSEFYRKLGSLLAPRGVLALSAPPARTAPSPALRDLLGSYAATLDTVFPHSRAIPADEQTLWLASPQNPLDLDTAALVRRWESLGLEARVLRADYLRYLLDGASAAARLSPAAPRAAGVENRDAYPAGLRYALAYESARLSPGLVPFFQLLGRVPPWSVAAGTAGLGLLLVLAVRRRRPAVAAAVATSGLAGMAASVLVILSFQVVYGSLYQQVGMLTTAFMAGLSTGSMAMASLAARLRRRERTLALWELLLLAALAGLSVLLALVLGRPDPTSSLAYGLLLAANLLVGLVVGAEFPLANAIVAVGEGGRTAGLLYAADLAGAMFGALLVAALLLPTLGLVGTAGVMLLVKAGSLLAVLRGNRA